MSSRICAWIVTSRAVVGSSAISSRGWQAMARVMITRCRCPPLSRCGYSCRRDAGCGIPTERSSSTVRSLAWCLFRCRWSDSTSWKCDSIVITGLSDVSGFCGIKPTWPPRDMVHGRRRELEQVAAFEDSLTPGDPPRGRYHPHHRQRRDALSRSALAHHANPLPGAHLQAEPLHGVDRVAFEPEGDLQVTDFEQRDASRPWSASVETTGTSPTSSPVTALP